MRPPLLSILPSFLRFVCIACGFHEAKASEPAQVQRAAAIIAALAENFEAPAWRGVVCSAPKRVEQASGQIHNAGLAPVWVTEVHAQQGARGYLMWEDSEEAPLVDFAWDAPAEESPPKLRKGAHLHQVANQQQFPVAGDLTARVASGCVPTAGANLIGFWAQKGFSAWAGSSQNSVPWPDLQLVTNRLRNRLHMQEIPDKDGFTDDGMTLSGAFPEDLRDCLQKDAADHGITLQTTLEAFSSDALKKETAAGRPVLLSCLVRLPQKPRLSWGHEVTGIGWIEIEGRFFAGVRDNFFPCASPQTTRWIGEGQIKTLIRAVPQPEPIRPK